MEGALKGYLKGNLKGDFEVDLEGDLEGELEGELEGDSKGDSKGDFTGDFKQNMEGDLLSSSDEVRSSSGLDQVWFSLQPKFNSFELDSEVGRLVNVKIWIDLSCECGESSHKCCHQ